MVEILFSQQSFPTISPPTLLDPDEVVAVVDDSPEIVLLLTHYLNNQGFEVVQATNANEFYKLLASCKIALVLMDIGLPDKNGNEILTDIVPSYPDLGIIMVTGTTDIEVALTCLRHGADDYLIKPVPMDQFIHTVENTLKKRRLVISNRIFQKALQISNVRMRFLHHLNLKMNTAYLNTRELRGILHTILAGITSDDGLRFNRAFLALFDDDNTYLQGILALGPSSKEEAGRIWATLKEQELQLDDILKMISENDNSDDLEVNRIIQTLKIPISDDDNVLIHSTRIKRPVSVINGAAKGCSVPQGLLKILGEDSFVVAPLYSPTKSLGVIIADNFVTHAPITGEDISDLEIFTSQASLAIEHSHLYEEMAQKISALEQVSRELEKSKDLLLEAERVTTIGQMSAQLLHAIRNPLTSIGGTSRLLTRKTDDPYFTDFLKIITEETEKIETILKDLFNFVDDAKLILQPHPLYALIRKSVMIFYSSLKEKRISYSSVIEGPGPIVQIDENRIRQLFMHLIRNSIEAMEEGGVLDIETQETDKDVTISIKDSGPGIPTEALPYVMDPFFTTKTYGNGTGLALVNRIMHGHKGEFTIANNPHRGTIASIKFPKFFPPDG